MPVTGIFRKPLRLAASKRIRSFWVNRCPTPRLPILPRVDSPRLNFSTSFLSGLGIKIYLRKRAMRRLYHLVGRPAFATRSLSSARISVRPKVVAKSAGFDPP